MKRTKKSYFGMSEVYRDAFLKIKASKTSDMIDLMNKELDKKSSTSASLTIENNDVSSNEPIAKTNRKRPMRKSRKKNNETTSNIEEENNIIDLTLCEDIDIELPKNNLIELSKEAKSKATTEILSQDDSFNLDEDDSEFKIIVLWKSYERKVFMIRKHQKLKIIFEFYAQKEEVKLEQIVFFTMNNRHISPEDSPNSLNFFLIEHIEGGISHESKNNVNTNILKKNYVKNEDMLEFKLLIKDQKRPILVSMKKTEKMKSIMLQAAEELNKTLDHLKLYFDGEMINATDSPEDLELEGGEIIEVKFKS